MDIKFTGLLNKDLILPVVIGLGSAVVVATIIATWVWGKRSKVEIPVTLVDPNAKYSLPLIDREEISHDTRRFRLGLPSPEHILGLPVGQHIHLSAKIQGDLVIRAYTPLSSDDEKGYLDLVIKVYFKNVHPKYPDGGKMSQHLENMKLGDTIDVRGPSGRLQYAGCGIFYIKKLRKDPPQKIVVTKVNMIAGGTGITPMLQLIRSIFKNSSDETRVRLLYANQSEQDILLRNEIEHYQKQYPRRMSVWYTIDKATEGWKYSVGFVTADMIREHLFPPAGSTLTVLCGPPPMLALACHPALDSLGYSQQMRFAY